MALQCRLVSGLDDFVLGNKIVPVQVAGAIATECHSVFLEACRLHLLEYRHITIIRSVNNGVKSEKHHIWYQLLCNEERGLQQQG